MFIREASFEWKEIIWIYTDIFIFTNQYVDLILTFFIVPENVDWPHLTSFIENNWTTAILKIKLNGERSEPRDHIDKYLL